jgi:hypothetical protein
MASKQIYTFTLTGPNKGRTMVINNRYGFENGVMVVTDRDTADKLEPILCDYYACELKVSNGDADVAAPMTGSLAKDETKGSAPAAPAAPK